MLSLRALSQLAQTCIMLMGEDGICAGLLCAHSKLGNTALMCSRTETSQNIFKTVP